MNPEFERLQQITRRNFLKTTGQFSLGAIALASLMAGETQAADPAPRSAPAESAAF